MRITLLLVLVACGKDKSEPSPTPPSSPATPSTPSTKRDPCALLADADITGIGLSVGTPKRESNMSDGGCTWTGSVGGGGFLHAEFLTPKQFAGWKKRIADKQLESTPVEGIGDEAFAVKGLAGEKIYVRRGETHFSIGGNARLDRAQVETLAKAAVTRL